MAPSFAVETKKKMLTCPSWFGCCAGTYINDNPYGPGGEAVYESQGEVGDGGATVALDASRPSPSHVW